MVGYLLKKEVDIIRKVDLKMDEHQKYEVIKKLVDANGNKDRAAMTLGLSRRQVDRLIAAYKEKGVTKSKKKRVKKELERRKEAAKTKKDADEVQANIVAVEDAHSRRPRRAYFGELEQMDASPYEWFGAEKTALHIAVDDATGAITGARFDSQETLKGYYGVYAARHI